MIASKSGSAPFITHSVFFTTPHKRDVVFRLFVAFLLTVCAIGTAHIGTAIFQLASSFIVLSVFPIHSGCCLCYLSPPKETSVLPKKKKKKADAGLTFFQWSKRLHVFHSHDFKKRRIIFWSRPPHRLATLCVTVVTTMDVEGNSTAKQKKKKRGKKPKETLCNA